MQSARRGGKRGRIIDYHSICLWAAVLEFGVQCAICAMCLESVLQLVS
jgi:hypothetical protein